ncbi:MAG TPA: AlkA N-terminal domain-containing protein [Thermoanaerobaculia bacterium]|nr:AlkA N-terminal domain-containing protein [Thermoanaerobaculia bacterium]
MEMHGVREMQERPSTQVRRRWSRARRARDPRFDGRFFVGVTSTGIYCRPICPAPSAKEENVLYFSSAAAAAAAGLRPCRRCRPEAAPGTPAWAGTSATVSRALRLIDHGALDDDGSVGRLASRLGVGSRQLRRLFERHLGASPVAVAQLRRLQFARRLIDETEIPLIDVAFAAGFGSVRRFNAAFRSSFGCAPRDFRRQRVEESSWTATGDGAGWRLRLDYRPPFDWERLLEFLAPRALPRIEAVAGGVYRRAFRLEELEGWLEVRPGRRRSSLDLILHCRRAPVSRSERCDRDPPGDGALGGERLPALLPLVQRCRSLFDLDSDPAAVAERFADDQELASRLVQAPGIRVPGAWDPFEIAVRAVLGQQVTVRGATTLAGRLIERWGERLSPGGESGAGSSLDRVFPAADRLVDAPLEQIGLPRARAEALRALARGVAEGEIVLDGSAPSDEVCAAMCRVRGLGDWTAQYVAMRALADPDAFPASDLHLRRALPATETMRGLSAKTLEKRAEAWRPWRAYAAMLLWQTEPAPPGSSTMRPTIRPTMRPKMRPKMRPEATPAPTPRRRAGRQKGAAR